MNQAEDRLAKACEALSTAIPDGASATLKANLEAAFRRHHVRRRRQRQAIGGLALISLVIVAGSIIFKARPLRVQTQPPLTQTHAPELSSHLQRAPNVAPPELSQGSMLVAKFTKRPRARSALPVPALSFVPLPSYEAAFSDGVARIVRLNLTKSDLYQMGAPQLSYPGMSQTIADVMFDRDGIPIAVRRVGK